VTDSTKPELLFDEPPKVYRLRLMQWIVEQKPGLHYDELLAAHNAENPDHPTSKETIVRNMKVLFERDQVFAEIPAGGEDGDARRRLWYPAERIK
jgi:hypothetical protein